ncbi:MAG: glycosyltransferase [Pseudomonadota bacterium]|nr:glycosyltransferase [Pseudomonadota bacterium]
MRLLQIFHGSNLANGVDRVTLTLTEGLVAAGVQVHALLPDRGVVGDELDRLGVAVTYAPLSCCEPLVPRARLKFFAAAARRSKVIAQLIDQLQIEVVHANTGHMLDAAVAAAMQSVPLIWHLHSPIEIDHARYTPHLDLPGYAALLQTLGSRVIAVSNDMADSFAACLPREHIDVLFSGVDIADLTLRAGRSERPLRDELELPADAQLVLGVGRISAQKDFASFARVASHVLKSNPRAYFLIAGPPEEPGALAALEREIEEKALGARVRLLGARNDIPRLVRASDVVLSTAAFEGQGMSSIEAMALRRPVVAMACVGLRECITHETDGLLVPLGGELAAAEAVNRVLSEPDFARRIGAQALLTVQRRFSREAFAQRFIEIARKCIDSHRADERRSLVPLVGALMQQIAEAEARVLAAEGRGRRGLLARLGGRLGALRT